MLATRARRRMAAVAGTALLFSLFTVGVDVVLPLWVTRDLQCTAGQWAELRSLRMTGVLVGVMLLGALSDRCGQRLVGALSMCGVAGLLLLFTRGDLQTLRMAMPLFGALVSTAFVNLNTLTQQVSARRQGLANSIYRGVGCAAGIVAPLLATLLAVRWHGYPPVFGAFAGVLVAAAFVLWLYPGEPTPPPAGALGAEVRRLWRGYCAALRQRPLLAFIVVSQLWGSMLAGVGAFAAIRFTQQLGQTDQQFGALSALAGGVTFLAVAGGGLFLDRVSLRKLHGWTGMLAGGCALLIGLGSTVWLPAGAYVAFGALATLPVGPSSMWVSRAAGDSTPTAAFTVHKVLSALFVALSMQLIGKLEGWCGMQPILIYGGLLGILTALAFFALPEPPSPSTSRLRVTR